MPMAYLAVAGLRLVPWDLGLAIASLAMFCAHVSGTSIAAYSRVAAPAFRLLDNMGMVARQIASRRGDGPPSVARLPPADCVGRR
jgi:hypothetical protein